MTREESQDKSSHKGQETKYTIPESFWEDDVDEENEAHPVDYIDSHHVDIFVDDEPNPSDNYGRTKYRAHVTHDEDGATCLYFTTHRWKGNFWRDIQDLDWKDTPEIVKQRLARVVACDGVDELDPEVRLIQEGGWSRWENIHKPRMEAMKANE